MAVSRERAWKENMLRKSRSAKADRFVFSWYILFSICMAAAGAIQPLPPHEACHGAASIDRLVFQLSCRMEMQAPIRRHRIVDTCQLGFPF